MNSDRDSRYIQIDPRDFISPPFVTCPHCGQHEFGILSIHDAGFSRRCRACWHTIHAELPPIRKSLIYLDQFAISNLLFADPGAAEKHGLNKTVDPFWHQLFGKLKNLLGLQLIVCPESSAHDRESALSRHHRPLKGTFESLSLGISFYDFEAIKRFQLTEHLHNWLGGEPERPSEIEPYTLLHRDPHVWTDQFLITLNLAPLPGYIEAVRAEREAAHDALTDVFRRWQENPEVTWEQWFEDEVLDYGPSVLKAYTRDLARFREVHEGSRPLAENDFFPTPNQILISILRSEIRDAAPAEEKVWPILMDFLKSPSLMGVPFNRTAAALYASVAKKAPHQKKLPTKGFFTDVDVISCLLPYCDAMFLDIECWNYLTELKASGRLPYATRFFSLRNKGEFVDYLDGLLAAASPAHLQLVREVYGL